jgi:mono/diheme cytochrome c family protein
MMTLRGKVKSMKFWVRQAGSRSLAVGAALAAAMLVAPIFAEPAAAQVSIWSGVYTQAQAKRGEEVYSGACAQCHGLRLNGAAHSDQPPSPAIARATFLRKWDGKTVAELFTYVLEMMPTDRPGTLTAQQSIDAVALMLSVSEIPAGDKELPTDPKALEGIVIEVKPK